MFFFDATCIVQNKNLLAPLLRAVGDLTAFGLTEGDLTAFGLTEGGKALITKLINARKKKTQRVTKYCKTS